MNGIIIVNQTVGHNEYKITRFKKAFNERNIHLDVFVNDGTLAKIESGNIIINLPKADFVLYLDKDIYLARMLEKSSYRLFNKADFIKLCDDKVLTFIGCANAGFHMVKTIASPLVYTDTLEESNYAFLNKVIDELGLPLVMKKVYGSLGEGVYLANTKEELFNLYSKYYRNPLLFQKYIVSSKGKSLRVLVVDGEPVGVIERNNSTNDFRSNFGEETFSRLILNNKKVEEFAKNISNFLKIEYAGLDFLYDENGDPILCEINSNAFFEEFEKTTKIDIASLYADMVVNKLKNKEFAVKKMQKSIK